MASPSVPSPSSAVPPSKLISKPTEKNPVFMLMLTGQIESADFPEFDELYCNYSFIYGQDWAVISGSSEGITQTAHRNRRAESNFVWNFPVDVSFKSTNPHGWPKIVISVYGNNVLGRDEVRGYGFTHLPVTQGMHTISIDMFVPEPTSHLQKLISWIIGRRPEFIDPKFIAQGEGREITRVASQGSVTLNANIILKDFAKQGFNNGSNSQQPLYNTIQS